MTLAIISALSRGIVMAPHDDETSSGGGAPEDGASVSAAVGGNALPGRSKKRISLHEKIEARKRSQIEDNGPDRSAPLIRRLGDDYSQVLPDFSQDETCIDSAPFGGEGIYIFTDEVVDYFIKHGRERLLFDASLFLAISVMGEVFVTYAKVDPGNAASSYADAIAAAEENWVWVRWSGGRTGHYLWGNPPVHIDPPTWPTDRSPKEIYAAVRAARLIDSVDHWLVQRIILGRK